MTTKTDKYLEYYKKANNRKEFIYLLLKDFPNLKTSTATRRWYDYTNEVKIESHEYSDREKISVTGPKLYMIQDMIKFKIKLSRPYLQKYGYNNAEINWLIDKKIINLKEYQ